MEDPQVQPGDGTDETNAKNLQTTFDGGLGDDFLLSWKPSKINTTAKFDIDDGLQPAPNMKLKMPEDFDIDMPNFDPGLTSKLSSFDVDLDFFESSDKDGSRDENGGSQNTKSQISKDQKVIILSEIEESSSPSEQEKDCILKSVDYENTSSLRSQDQYVNRSKVIDFDNVSSWKNQEESRRNADTTGHNSDTSLVKHREALITRCADEHVTLSPLPVERMVEVATPPRKVTLPQNLSHQVSSSLPEKSVSTPPEKSHQSVRVDEIIRNGTEISDLQPSKENYTREVHSSKDAASIPMSVDVKNDKQLPIPMKDLDLRVQPVLSPRELNSSRQTRITAKTSSSEKPLHGHVSNAAVRALSFENDPPSILTKKVAEDHRVLRKRSFMSPTFAIAEGESHNPSTTLESLNPTQVESSTLNTSKPLPLSSSRVEQRTGAFSSKAVHRKVQKPNETTKIDKVDSYQDIKSSASRAKGNRAHGYTWNITS